MALTWRFACAEIWLSKPEACDFAGSWNIGAAMKAAGRHA